MVFIFFLFVLQMKDMIESLHSYYDFVARKSLHLDTVIVFSMPVRKTIFFFVFVHFLFCQDDPTPNNVAAEADDLDVIFNEEADESKPLGGFGALTEKCFIPFACDSR